MGALELLLGKNPKDCTRQELEDWVLKGRLAREADAAGSTSKRKSSSGGGKKKQAVPDFDLLDDDVPEFDLED